MDPFLQQTKAFESKRKMEATQLKNKLEDFERVKGDFKAFEILDRINPTGTKSYDLSKLSDEEQKLAKSALFRNQSLIQKLNTEAGEGPIIPRLVNYLKYGGQKAGQETLPSTWSNTIDVKPSSIKPVEVEKSLGKGLNKGLSLGAGIVRGLAEAPAYEFLNPPSAGPSDYNDPVNQFERGLISQEEFLRKMGK